MDTLALLCNLHADGPATLQRLRREGCESLEALLELEAPVLSRCLGSSEEVSRRFLREALVLAERLGEPVAWEISEEVIEEFEGASESDALREPEPGEPEEPGEPGGEGSAYTVDELLADEGHGQGEESEEYEYEYEYVLVDVEEADEQEELVATFEEELPEDGTSELPADKDDPQIDPEAVQEVVAAWRTLDDSDPPLRPDEARVEPGGAGFDDEELRDYVVEPGPGSSNRPLARVELPGLDRPLVHRLAQLGIHSLGGLVEAPTTALARRLALPFTRLRRLQFLARRELASAAPEVPAPGGRPTTGAPGSSSAGPFA